MGRVAWVFSGQDRTFRAAFAAAAAAAWQFLRKDARPRFLHDPQEEAEKRKAATASAGGERKEAAAEGRDARYGPRLESAKGCVHRSWLPGALWQREASNHRSSSIFPRQRQSNSPAAALRARTHTQPRTLPSLPRLVPPRNP